MLSIKHCKLGVIAAVGAGLLAISTWSLPTRAQEQTELQRIIDTKVVRLGAVNSYPNYKKDLKTGKWTGMLPDFVELMFSSIGVTVEYVPTDWGTASAGIQAGRYDLMGAYIATPQRALAVNFTKPVFSSSVSLLSLKPLPEQYKNWKTADSADLKVAGVDGSGTTRSAQGKLPHATWRLFKSFEAVLLELESGRVDAVATPEEQALLYLRTRKEGSVTVPEPIISTPSSIAVRKGATDLRDWLNVAITYYQQQGELTKIMDKYLGSAD